MNNKQHVTFVSPQGDAYAPSNFIREKDTECVFVNSILDVYPLLSDSNFRTNVVSLDIEKLYEQHGNQVWDLVNALATIIKSTVCRDESGKSARRTTVITGGVTMQTDTKLIKDFLSLNDLVVGVFPRGPEFSLEDKLVAMNAFQLGKNHVPEKIQLLLNKKKPKQQKTEIELTPRQEQVLKFIKERGSSNKAIAKMLDISESTVKLHVGQIIKKFGVKNRTQLALFS
jgi:DNA-binding CsgD family transcriptional regulator